MKGIDHTGKSYGSLTVLGEAPKHSTIKHRRVFVRCGCGSEKSVNLPALLSGRIKSCGCSTAENMRIQWSLGSRQPKPIVSLDDLNKVIRYVPSTGQFFWKERPSEYFNSDKSCCIWNAQWANREVGALDEKGYLVTSLGGMQVRLHRLAYFMIHGEWPKVSVDHENGVKSDNRWINLRHASRSENQRNQKRPKTNTSGHKGVIFDKLRQSWYFQMRKDDGSRFSKSGFKTKEEAVTACRVMREQLHGQFANHG